MAYNKFKRLEQLEQDFGIQNFIKNWLPIHTQVFPDITDYLAVAMQEASREALTSEKAKSESVVVPILKELKRKNPNKFSYFSGLQFDVDKSKKLNGFCDFLLSLEAEKLEISAPVFCLIEAKDDEIDKGYAQCGAEMYAALLFNEKRGTPRKVIYGCVTNAFSWCFLKLEDKKLYIDTNYVPLSFTRPHEVLAVLQWILDKSLANE
ncbi:MAG: hypothetical protein ACOVQA_03935 [Thermoflexibacteraceae bacterium]|jgi:hypothetical protein